MRDDVFLADVLISCGSMVCLMLRASRHFSVKSAEYEDALSSLTANQSNSSSSFNDSSEFVFPRGDEEAGGRGIGGGVGVGDCGTSAATTSSVSSSGVAVTSGGGSGGSGGPVPTAKMEARFVLSTCKVTRATTSGATVVCGCQDASTCRVCRNRAAAELLTSMAYYSNLMSLTSNCMTHLLRHSQILYAFLMAAGDALILSRAHSSNNNNNSTTTKGSSETTTRRRFFLFGAAGGTPPSSSSSSAFTAMLAGTRRWCWKWRYAWLLLGLSVLLRWSYEHMSLYWVGDLCGYLAGLCNLFLLGSTVAGPSPVLVTTRRRLLAAGGGGGSSGSDSSPLRRHSVLWEFVVERLAAMLASLCYLWMLGEEGEAVYSCHMEVVRWYGCVAATLLIDTTQLVRFLKAPHVEIL